MGGLHDESQIVSDSEVSMMLEIISPKLNGSPVGWVFSSGEGEKDFTARVDDTEFLQDVKNGKYAFKNGNSIQAIVRTIQKKSSKLVTERIIIEVLNVLS